MNAYEAACEAHNEAIKVYQVARTKFYAVPGIASDADIAEFLAAQKAKKIADAAFDAAYAIEEAREEEIVAEVDDAQIEMFAA